MPISPSRRSPPDLILLLFSGVILATFLSLGVHEFAGLYDAFRAVGWPEAPGTVTHSEVVTRQGKGCNYLVDFRYRFSVDGKEYDGTRLMYGGGPCNYTPAHAIVDGHPAGAKVSVHYMPGNPEENVIEPGKLSGNDWTGIFMCPLLVAAGLWMVIRAWTGRIKMRR